MHALSLGVERTLLERLPEMERVVTSFRDPLFEDEEYRAFLGSLGYQPVAPAALGKQVKAA